MHRPKTQPQPAPGPRDLPALAEDGLGRPLTFPPGYGYTVTGTRFDIPREPLANLEYRRRVLEHAESDFGMQATLRGLCADPSVDACLYWINTFAWITLESFILPDGTQRAGEAGVIKAPFVTWPCQDAAVVTLYDAITTGRDVINEKSRDMGATKLILAVFHWFWQFRPGFNFLELSRKAEMVDNAGDPKALFSIHDMMHACQPAWLASPITRAQRKLINTANGNSIVGDTTTGDVGHGARPQAALCDEAARMDGFRTIWQGLASATNCRIANSTANGPVYFAELCEKQSSAARLTMPWHDHPAKGRGRRPWTHPQTGERYVFSPWFEQQLVRVNADPLQALQDREIRENLLMDHMGAGSPFFSSSALNRQVSAHVRPPDWSGFIDAAAPTDDSGAEDLDYMRRLVWSRRDINGVDVVEARDLATRGGGWSIWSSFAYDAEERVRPPQDRTYIFGVDIGHGAGQSNSVVSVFCVEAGAKVGEFATTQHSPEQLAACVCVAALWWGGCRRLPFLIWEANGPGGHFGQVLLRLGYPWYYSRTKDDERGTPRTPKIGWHSSPSTKEDLLREFDAALRRDLFKQPSAEAVRECRGYGRYQGGVLGAMALEDLSTGAAATHGDRVIADALSWYGSRLAGRFSPPPRTPPPGSPAERRARQSQRAEQGPRRVRRRG